MVVGVRLVLEVATESRLDRGALELDGILVSTNRFEEHLYAYIYRERVC